MAEVLDVDCIDANTSVLFWLIIKSFLSTEDLH